MGKRKKSSKPQGPKKRDPLPTSFSCLFCNHENSVNVKLDRKAGTGELVCKICGQQFQTAINYLSAAVDVYADWVDACENVTKESGAQGAALDEDYAQAGQNDGDFEDGSPSRQARDAESDLELED